MPSTMAGVASKAPFGTVNFHSSSGRSGSSPRATPVACESPRKIGQSVSATIRAVVVVAVFDSGDAATIGDGSAAAGDELLVTAGRHASRSPNTVLHNKLVGMRFIDYSPPKHKNQVLCQ
jgi:hypothetical protein